MFFSITKDKIILYKIIKHEGCIWSRLAEYIYLEEQTIIYKNLDKEYYGLYYYDENSKLFEKYKGYKQHRLNIFKNNIIKIIVCDNEYVQKDISDYLHKNILPIILN